MNLIITVACDFVGFTKWRKLAKIWTASVLRGMWTGEMRIFRNFDNPMFPVSRADAKEFYRHESLESRYDFAIHEIQGNLAVVYRYCVDYKLRCALLCEDIEKFDRVVLADADCVALRNIDHLMSSSKDVLVGGNIHRWDLGFIAIKSDVFRPLVRQWINARSKGDAVPNDREILKDLIQRNGWTLGHFERGEVVNFKDQSETMERIMDAAIVHLSGLATKKKQDLSLALHLMRVYGSEDGIFFDILES